MTLTPGTLFSATITLFVVANLVPVLPTVFDQTSHLEERQGRRARIEALLAAYVLVLLFSLGGPDLFRVVGVAVDDLRVAGGAILLTFATYDLLFSRNARKQRDASWQEDPDDGVGIVPLGIPIMVGPATLVTAVVVFESFGVLTGVVALLINIALNFALLFIGRGFMKVTGEAYSRAIAKVMSLLLATIAVAMIRVGIQGMLAQPNPSTDGVADIEASIESSISGERARSLVLDAPALR